MQADKSSNFYEKGVDISKKTCYTVITEGKMLLRTGHRGYSMKRIPELHFFPTGSRVRNPRNGVPEKPNVRSRRITPMGWLKPISLLMSTAAVKRITPMYWIATVTYNVSVVRSDYRIDPFPQGSRRLHEHGGLRQRKLKLDSERKLTKTLIHLKNTEDYAKEHVSLIPKGNGQKRSSTQRTRRITPKNT